MIKKLFGGEFEIILHNLSDELKEKLEREVYSYGLELQEIFNFYSETSELSRLNELGELEVSDELLNLLKMSLEVSSMTDGEFDVTIAENIVLRKSGEEIEELNYSYKYVKVNGNNVVLPKGMKIDFGSCAKGYIVDLMINFLKKNGAAEGFIDADGDMIAFGEKEYVIGIADPRNKGKDLGSVTLNNSAIATSGDYNQFYGSHENSHIINQKDLISVSVLSGSLFLSDIYSTALFVLDKKNREKLINEKNLHCITVDSNKNINVYGLNN